MNLRFSVANGVPPETLAIGHLVFEGLEPADDDLEVDARRWELSSFSGKAGETLIETEGDRLRVLVGAGTKAGFSPNAMRQAAASFARTVAGTPTVCLDLAVRTSLGIAPGALVQAAVEGVSGGCYKFARYRTVTEPMRLESVVLLVSSEGAGAAGVQAALQRGIAVAEAVSLARDLGNTPATDMNPSRMAEVALEVAEQAGLEVRIYDEDEIRAEGLGGLLGVARGSAEPPRMIKLTYEPAAADSDSPGGEVPTVALVGKGITFDSGGLSLKTGEGMMTMKDDMSGAAAVIAALGACKAAGVKVKVTALAMCTENLPSGTATKPGDVLTTRNGKTIEVLNTDAEGRLVLADGLALAAEAGVDAIIDVATLTGACVVALGTDLAGVMSNDSRLVAAVKRAGEAAGEPLWQLPLPRSYRRLYESEIADMKNIGKPGNAGALVAGLILEEFVGDRPWAHLDIAGPAFTDDETYDRRKGSTGFIVRTLIEFLSNYEPIGASADLLADGSLR